MSDQWPLSGLVVVDISSGIPGGYCTRLFADAGADVVKLESPAGDPLRRWRNDGKVPDGEDGALFQFLACTKESIVVDPDDELQLERALALISSADLVVWSPGTRLAEHGALHPWALRLRFPHLDVVAITSFGLDVQWTQFSATEFTMQAWAGGIWHRGPIDQPPVSVAGRVGEWSAGLYAAIGALASQRRRRSWGSGQLMDVSILEAIGITLTSMHPVTYFHEMGEPMTPHRWSIVPGIHPTKDGWVGFMMGSGRAWLDFCVMVGREDWMNDESLILNTVRQERRHEIFAHVDSWTCERTTDEVLEFASALRIPCSPIGAGPTTPTFDHFVDQKMFVENPGGRFIQPAVPYRIHADGALRPLTPAPKLGEHSAFWDRRTQREIVGLQPSLGMEKRLPFDDLRVIELTNFWAGPSAGNLLGMLGADVIKIESPTRPDPMRRSQNANPGDRWWDLSPLFHATNTNKLGVGIELDRSEGVALLRGLLERSDVLLENFSPRVLDNFGVDVSDLQTMNPGLISVRMPAFGLEGPWRDRTGFAQTMEQASGMAWITGYPDSSPQVPNSPCDPLAGAHAVWALQVALERRRRTGKGCLVEVPMVMGALNIAAEPVIEYSAYGTTLNRMGNRGSSAAPQNLYRTSDTDDTGVRDSWIALSIETDDQWLALADATALPTLADLKFATYLGRREGHDVIDRELAEWCQCRSGEEIVELLWPRGIPVGKVTPPHHDAFLPPFLARGFFERVENPIARPTYIAGLPVRFSAGPHQLHRRHAPMLGEHNHEVLVGLLGLSEDDLANLESNSIIGTRPKD